VEASIEVNVMIRVKKKDSVKRCPWCKSASSLVFEKENEGEYCMSCKRNLLDREKKIEVSNVKFSPMPN